MESLTLSLDSRHVPPGDEDEAKERAAQLRRLQAILDAQGLSKRDLSLRIGKGHSHLSQLFAGDIKDAGTVLWRRIARETGARIGYLLDGEAPIFSDTNSTERYPSLTGILDTAQHLHVDISAKVVRDLLADNAHKEDPGPAYWSAQLSMLIAKHSHRS